MKKLAYALAFMLLILPLAKGATISPSTINLDVFIGNLTEGKFNITLDNETCSPDINSQIPIYGFPSFKNATGNFEVSFLVYAPRDLMSGSYTSKVSYCDAQLTININVKSQSSPNCPVQLRIYGEKIPGKTIKFDLRNSNYERVRNPDTLISIESSETGNTYEVDCPEGSCTWKIPENEKGRLMIEVLVPGCGANILTTELELEMAGSISISVPSKVWLGDDFYIYIFDPAKGALKYVRAQVIAPDGSVFNGKTNEYGILYDEALLKVYGRDIKPEKEGEYKIFATILGYNSANVSFKVEKKPCPYECCVGDNYVEKTCEEGFKCVNNKCVEIEKPKIKINCTPEPTLFKTSHCVLFSDGKKLEEDVNVKFTLNGKTETILFDNGEADIEFEEKGEYKLEANLEGYEPGILKGEVAMGEPVIPKTLLIGFIVVVVILIVVVLLKFKKKKGGVRFEIEAPKAPLIEGESKE